MKKYLLIAFTVVGIILVLILVSFIYISPKKIVEENKATSTPEIVFGVKSVVFEDKNNSFKIWYPENSEIKNESGNFLSMTKNSAIQIFVSSTKFSGTNLSEAVVAVGVDSDTSTLAICQTAANGDQAQGLVTISGKDFYLFTGTDAGAGNLYEYKDYRRAENGHCYEISEVLHSGNIYNYEPGAVKEFDKPYFFDFLDKIAKSFEFVN